MALFGSGHGGRTAPESPAGQTHEDAASQAGGRGGSGGVVTKKSLLPVALAIISIALVDNRSAYGVLLTCILLTILTLFNMFPVSLLARVFEQYMKSQAVRALILFVLFFLEMHFIAFGAYLGIRTFYYGWTPLVLNGQVTTWGYLYSGVTAFLMAVAVSCLTSKRRGI